MRPWPQRRGTPWQRGKQRLHQSTHCLRWQTLRGCTTRRLTRSRRTFHLEAVQAPDLQGASMPRVGWESKNMTQWVDDRGFELPLSRERLRPHQVPTARSFSASARTWFWHML
eukprot:1598404-Pyramimonas_sp.AAC.1